MTALLNCLVREVASPESGRNDGHRIYRLPATGHLLRVRAGRYPAHPALHTPGGWLPLSLDLLVALTAEELTACTGVSNDTLAGEVHHSRDVVATLLSTRRTPASSTQPFIEPTELFLRSEQALVAGHRYHPAPKARGGLGPDAWLPYAPEARARFPLTLLWLAPEIVLEEGDATALDALGPPPPDGGLLLPAHPWQLELLGGPAALRDGRLRGLGETIAVPYPGETTAVRDGRLRYLGETTAVRDGRLRYLGETTAMAVPTSSLRTVYLPDADLFCKFSLDVRITNDVRRLWARDLRRLTAVDGRLRRGLRRPARAPAETIRTLRPGLPHRGPRRWRRGAGGGRARRPGGAPASRPDGAAGGGDQ